MEEFSVNKAILNVKNISVYSDREDPCAVYTQGCSNLTVACGLTNTQIRGKQSGALMQVRQEGVHGTEDNTLNNDVGSENGKQKRCQYCMRDQPEYGNQPERGKNKSTLERRNASEK